MPAAVAAVATAPERATTAVATAPEGTLTAERALAWTAAEQPASTGSTAATTGGMPRIR
ncbi:hypothetical protein [Mycobacterium ostraviense]|uniref:hypothetical protein n=1 Tax=Mycobacterium ostraviense TaxID=2738409 RepID=UPI00278C3CD5|nr:hypothetical protein [Mycobacterium ostraviense]